MKEGTQTEGRGYLMTEGGVHRHWTQTVGRGYLVADGGGYIFYTCTAVSGTHTMEGYLITFVNPETVLFTGKTCFQLW